MIYNIIDHFLKIYFSWVLANIMSESSCHFWICNRNLGQKFCSGVFSMISYTHAVINLFEHMSADIYVWMEYPSFSDIVLACVCFCGTPAACKGSCSVKIPINKDNCSKDTTLWWFPGHLGCCRYAAMTLHLTDNASGSLFVFNHSPNIAYWLWGPSNGSFPKFTNWLIHFIWELHRVMNWWFYI